MRVLHESGAVSSLAWVVMPDHVHWLFQLGEAQTLSSVVKSFKARSAQRVNRYLNRQGALWQKAFYDHAAWGRDVVVGANSFAGYLVNKQCE